MQYRRWSGYFGFISDSEPGLALLLIWLSVWRTPVRGFRRFWTASMELCVKVFRMSCCVVAGPLFSAVFGSGRVFIEVSCRWRSVTGTGPRCADLSIRMSGTCGAKRKHRSHNTGTPQRDSENERNHE